MCVFSGCVKPQIQPVLSSRNVDVPFKNNLQFFTIPCAVIAFAVVLSLISLHVTKMNRAKEKTKTLVKIDENLLG